MGAGLAAGSVDLLEVALGFDQEDAVVCRIGGGSDDGEGVPAGASAGPEVANELRGEVLELQGV